MKEIPLSDFAGTLLVREKPAQSFAGRSNSNRIGHRAALSLVMIAVAALCALVAHIRHL